MVKSILMLSSDLFLVVSLKPKYENTLQHIFSFPCVPDVPPTSFYLILSPVFSCNKQYTRFGIDMHRCYTGDGKIDG